LIIFDENENKSTKGEKIWLKTDGFDFELESRGSEQKLKVN